VVLSCHPQGVKWHAPLIIMSTMDAHCLVWLQTVAPACASRAVCRLTGLLFCLRCCCCCCYRSSLYRCAQPDCVRHGSRQGCEVWMTAWSFLLRWKGRWVDREVRVEASGFRSRAGPRAAFARPVRPAGCQLVQPSVNGSEERSSVQQLMPWPPQLWVQCSSWRVGIAPAHFLSESSAELLSVLTRGCWCKRDDMQARLKTRLSCPKGPPPYAMRGGWCELRSCQPSEALVQHQLAAVVCRPCQTSGLLPCVADVWLLWL